MDANRAADSSIPDKSNGSKGMVFLAFIGGSGLMSGFGAALGMARKRDPDMFVKGVSAGSGTSLAVRALAWGTLYAVTGVAAVSCVAGTFIYINSESLRSRLPKWLPAVPKNDPPGRSEFSSVRELIHYVAEERKE